MMYLLKGSMKQIIKFFLWISCEHDPVSGPFLSIVYVYFTIERVFGKIMTHFCIRMCKFKFIIRLKLNQNKPD